MAVKDYNVSAALNTSISGIDIAENALAANTNNAFRQLMADAKAESLLVTRLESSGGGIAQSGATNTVALLAAIAALSSGGTIVLGAGNYNFALTVSFALPSNITLCGAGKGATTITRTDSSAVPWFVATNTSGNGFSDFTAVGNSVATGYPGTDVSGAFIEYRQTSAASARVYAPTFADVELRNFKADGWIICIQVGNPSYDMVGPRIEGSCSFRSTSTSNCRGPSDLAIPQAAIWIQGNTTVGGTTRIRGTYVGPVYADIPHIKGLVGVACGVDGCTIDHPFVENVGTLGIANDKAGYAILYINEIVGAPNVTNLFILGPTIANGKSAGVYGANWGGSNRATIYFDGTGGYIGNLLDTSSSTLAKGAFAAADNNTDYVIRNLVARQCVSAIDIRLASNDTLLLDNIRHENVSARVAIKSETNIGKGIFTLDPITPVVSGYQAGQYSVIVTSGGGTATPTFTVKDPANVMIGTYVAGAAAFSTQIKFTIADGAPDFATGDTFYVIVEVNQPASSQTAISIGKQSGKYNTAPTGEIVIGDIYVRDHGASSRGIRIRGEDASANLNTFGRITFKGRLDIETQGPTIEMWGENSSTVINPYTGGVYFQGTGRLKSQASYGVRIRACSSELVFGGSYVIARSDNISAAAAALAGLDLNSNMHVKAGSLTLSGQGAHASDAGAWDGASSTGTIQVGGVTFLNTLNAYRAAGLGTALPAWTPSPNADGAVVDNISKTDGGPVRWDYVNFAWKPVRGLYIAGSATYDPASLADGAGATTTVAVTGAALGDFADASFSLDLQGVSLTAWVSAANTVSVRFQNESGGVLDLGSGTLRARVEKL